MNQSEPRRRQLFGGGMLLPPLVLLVLAPIAIYFAIDRTRQNVLADIRDASDHTLNLVMENLRGELARFQALPHLLASDPVYLQLWQAERTTELMRRINLRMENNANITGALDLYIMDLDGTAIAASNWELERSFVGKNFSYRPYFQTALQGSLGRYFAIGTSSGERGYYFSYPIRDGKLTLGVMVCKIQVGKIEAAWKDSNNDIIVTDRHGIVFLSSNPDWLFKSLSRLDEEKLRQVKADRQYDNIDIATLNIATRRELADNSALIRLGAPQGGARPAQLRAPLTREYLMISRDMLPAGWRVHILSRTSAVQAEVWQNAFGVGVLLFSLLIGVVLVADRLRRGRERLEIQRRTKKELERRVEERTQELEHTQAELIQAGKLAVLGKMSAGLSHELNQPLAAIRSYSDNAAQFLDRGNEQAVHDNLRDIAQLTDRMARIIKNLRTFARKDKVEAGPTDVVAAARQAAALLAHRIGKEGVDLLDELPDAPVLVFGGEVRLQQVFVNIIANALDAMAASKTKRLRLSLSEEDSNWVLSASDNGPGLRDDDMQRVFDPFFSTKEVGEGVGLGLSISYGIVEQFGGHIDIENLPGGGARFSVRLKKAEAEPSTRAAE